MSTLLPTHAVTGIIEGLSEYLTTTLGLSEPRAKAAFDEFLADSGSTMFRGPYVRTRMPFRASTDTDSRSLDWLPPHFTPYAHQRAAFEKLRTLDPATGGDTDPSPTLVVTGTGSGKTEAFLYPVIDHAIRERRRGVTGIKALILYPMNALAGDQANRLAKLLTGDPRLAELTAGIYTGEHRSNHGEVTEDGLISERSEMQRNPPDILLTNYKMLDQLLLRPGDHPMWAASCTSLRYVVLDEFHTYDGAQGTDVAILLRRLGMKLKELAGIDDPRPLGPVCPVATSATMGSKDDPGPVLDFAERVFGVPFTPDSIVRESRVPLGDFASVPAEDYTTPVSWWRHEREIRELVDTLDRHDASGTIQDALHPAFARFFSSLDPENPVPGDINSEALAWVPRNRFLLRLLELTSTPCTINQLTSEFFNLVEDPDPAARAFIVHLVAELSLIRATLAADRRLGTRIPGVDVHLWVRELSRIDRLAMSAPEFRWSDDSDADHGLADERHWLPAIFCRACYRSGWMTELEPGSTMPTFSAGSIRGASVSDEKRARTRPLIYAGEEADAADSRHGVQRGPDAAGQLFWLDTRHAQFLRFGDVDPTQDVYRGDIDEGSMFPVLTYLDADADERALDQVCPACDTRDSIRYIGSAVATLLSVSVSNLFGLPGLDDAEKKTLIFTDSVQDAAHRAGFVEARSHAFSLRTGIASALGAEPVSLAALQNRILARADTAADRFQLLPPDLARDSDLQGFWDPKTRLSDRLRPIVPLRIGFDVALEFGRRSELGRTLMVTGVATAEVEAPDLLRSARRALDSVQMLDLDGHDGGLTDDALLAWARGIVERIRSRGGIEHPWLLDYRYNDGAEFYLTRGRGVTSALPPFAPGTGPVFPRVGGPIQQKKWNGGTDPVAGAHGWYARWTARQLGMAREQAARLCVALLDSLVTDGTLTSTPTRSDARTYALPTERIMIRRSADGRALRCTVCHTLVPVGPATERQLAGARCLTPDCSGVLEVEEIAPNYYRRLYTSGERRSIIAREHTSLIPSEKRQAIEAEFRGSGGDPRPDAVNVLVATPTLEMGIDIGDLSTVMLSSMPVSVASYLQRVGRAGRLTGNSLAVAVVRGRGQHLPKIHEPLSVIDGDVVPPAVYLSAVEILRRQLLAAVLDALAGGSALVGMSRSRDVFRQDDGLYAKLLDAGVPFITEVRDRFIESLGSGNIDEHVTRELIDWDLPGAVAAASQRWEKELEEIGRQLRDVQGSLHELGLAAEAAGATDQDRSDYALAVSAEKLLRAQQTQLTGDTWVAALERFGLLPNYTLLDDSVELRVSGFLRHTDSAAEIERQEHSYSRGLSSALTELAPGSTFYAEGMKILIDAVDLGANGDRIQRWRLCPSCSHVEVLTPEQDFDSCPACGDDHFAAVEQEIPVVPMHKVSAQIRPERSLIDGSQEERQRAMFTTALAVRLPDRSDMSTWYLEKSGFGVTNLREVELRWLNLGSGSGPERYLAGDARSFPLFTLCRYCGQVDRTAGGNDRRDHRGWCQNAKKLEQDNVEVALGRVLHTQGVLLHLPSSVQRFGPMGAPSLVAAIKFGFKAVLGGSPEHLDVTEVVVPAPGERSPETRTALLLHDLVPGGTGYLSEFSRPEKVWQLLETAYRALKSCPCADEQRLSCPQCLLPFTRAHQETVVSRQVAESALLQLVVGDEDVDDLPAFDSAAVTQQRPQKAQEETPLEIRTRDLIVRKLEELGATIDRQPVGNHVHVHARIPGQAMSWSLKPQQLIAGGTTRPDFVLESTAGENAPRFAIYCDSVEYHASPQHNRLVDDARKREQLRLEGYVPWAITWRDLGIAESGTTTTPWWYHQQVAAGVARKFGIAQVTLDSLQRDPVTLLLDIILQPDLKVWQHAAAALPMILGPRMTRVTSSTLLFSDGPLSLMLKLGSGGPAAMAEADARLEFDASDHTMADLGLEAYKTHWYHWLEWSNLLSLRRKVADITATDLADVDGVEEKLSAQVPPPSGDDVEVHGLPAEWLALIDEAISDTEESALRAIAESVPLPPLPEQGEEVEGCPLDLVWRGQRVAFTVDAGESVLDTLRKAGWTVFTTGDTGEVPDDLVAELIAHLTDSERGAH
ncbi:DEAD/DEAH box helicase [Corynebacterium sp. CCM 8835]|uniref:DEAD/DEAH box helicase n=1 Tax=Corynebacterium antarcticum TaxID=2800405 RepID=A0ABS1FNH5_9CORY|nr:DEAD/DEAH box helicase [Corynebacterium antarcticum]MCL0245222.1 DEAD/DEAH box helicase [Corynebacterium antarcticum]